MTFKIDETCIDIIHWVDAQADSSWESLGEPALAYATTLGFVVAENKQAVTIASTWSSPHSNCRMHIPKAWIKSRQTVKLPKNVVKKPVPRKAAPSSGSEND